MKSMTYSVFQEIFQCKVFINEALSKATESDASQQGLRHEKTQRGPRPGWV
jgi:hypothetical protein